MGSGTRPVQTQLLKIKKKIKKFKLFVTFKADQDSDSDPSPHGSALV